MAKTAKKKVSRIKTKKKIWFKIITPKLFGNKEIGETYLPNVEKAVGRVMQVNLRNLTGNVKDQNAYVEFQISKAEGSTLRTETIGFRLTPQYVKRAVRKNTARMDDYFTLKTKDGKELVLKTLMVSRGRLQRSVKTSLRKQLGELLKEEVSKNTLDSLMGMIIGYKLQIGLKKKLNKINPMKEVTVRVLKVKTGAKRTKEEPARNEVQRSKASSTAEAVSEGSEVGGSEASATQEGQSPSAQKGKEPLSAPEAVPQSEPVEEAPKEVVEEKAEEEPVKEEAKEEVPEETTKEAVEEKAEDRVEEQPEEAVDKKE
jgi:small subunit ribosomal protein S3Ae